MSARRVYETTIIINAALEDQDIDAALSKVTTYIENHGGEIKEINRWGRKRLAYPINKKFNGFYCHIIFEAMPDTVPVFERFLVLEDTILRHLTLILPDKLREFRAQRELEEGKRREEEAEEQDDRPESKSRDSAHNKPKSSPQKANEDTDDNEVEESESVEESSERQ